MSEAQTRDLTIQQGATFREDYVWREGTPEAPGDPISLVGATLRMQIRKSQGGEVLLEATIGDGLSTGGIDGTIVLLLPPSKTNNLSVRSARYDLEATYSVDDVHRVLEGRVIVKPNITQDPGEPVVAR